jgi:hypothetical protein
MTFREGLLVFVLGILTFWVFTLGLDVKSLRNSGSSSARIQNLEDRHMELSATVVELRSEVKRLREAFY